MKIRMNYELMEQISLAKRGISLRRCGTQIIHKTTLVTALVTPILATDGLTLNEIYEEYKLLLALYSVVFGSAEIISSPFGKRNGKRNLQIIANKLKDIYIDTNIELLTEAKSYHTEYKLNYETFPPKLEEHKYIMVAVNNDWGNNERSLHQEHIIGTRYYDYSYGEPDKEKVYSYARKRAIK